MKGDFQKRLSVRQAKWGDTGTRGELQGIRGRNALMSPTWGWGRRGKGIVTEDGTKLCLEFERQTGRADLPVIKVLTRTRSNTNTGDLGRQPMVPERGHRTGAFGGRAHREGRRGAWEGLQHNIKGHELYSPAWTGKHTPLSRGLDPWQTSLRESSFFSGHHPRQPPRAYPPQQPKGSLFATPAASHGTPQKICEREE